MSEIFECKLCQGRHFKLLQSSIRDWEYGAPGEFSYYECNACQQIQIHPFPSLDQLKQAYPEVYPAYILDIKNSRGWFYNLLLALHTRLRLRPIMPYLRENAKILDVGSGNGDFLCCFKTYNISNLNGIDFNEHAIENMKLRGIDAFHGMYMDYPSNPETFDLISMNHYIEHVLNPVAEIEKSYRLLKKDGVLFGILPNFNGLDRSLFKRFWGGNHVPRHTFQYTDRQLRLLLERAGFKKVKITHDINPGHIAISIQNWLQRNSPNLKDNPNISYGRMKYFNLLLLLSLPLNIIFALMKRSGTIGFLAVK